MCQFSIPFNILFMLTYNMTILTELINKNKFINKQRQPYYIKWTTK